ncbi:hypothetical protein ACIOK4_00215 [Streptomyces bottropensis]|uniref:hypothetical protein n=1 Tax=Streptomyces bottropensis TaxID=42235 RepID=UPI00382E3CB3
MITIVVPAAPAPIPPPRYEDYPSHDAYVLAFRIARAQRNDHLLNREESAAQLAVIEQVIRSRPDRPRL